MRATLRLASCGALLCLATTLPGCGGAGDPDAYGNFEATEVVVSAEASGRLLWFTADDGQKLAAGAVVGVIDTIQLALERAQVAAQSRATGSRAREVEHQLAVLRAQHEIAQREYDRTQRLHSTQSATAQQLDQAERDFRTLGQQIEVTLAQQQTVRQDLAANVARVGLIDDKLRRSRIANPRGGTVLASYVEPGEFVQQGQPLYKIADLDSMDLRAYVTQPQLAQVRIGHPAEVTIDDVTHTHRVLKGTVTWVSAEAEFTPTPIQTREERAELVYAVKIRVPNADGVVKIGMPADVRFVAAESSSTASTRND